MTTDATANTLRGVQDKAKAFLIFSGSNERAIVAFCRRLKQRNLAIHIIARNEKDPVFRTQYRKNVVATRTTDLLDHADLDRCITIAHDKSPETTFVVAPTSEFFDVFLLENVEFFRERSCSIPLVDLALYRLVSDKFSFSRLCRDYGMAIPREISATNCELPFVAKPLQNVTNGKRSLYPWLIHNQLDWDAFKRKENPNDYYFEEFISGASHYLLMYLPRAGEATLFSQRNLIQQPHGKSILLAESSSIHTEPFAQKFVDLLRSLDFSGLAMIEVMQCGEDFVFIELNPRFWGPAQLMNYANSQIFDRFIDDSLGLAPAASNGGTTDATYLWSGGIMRVLAAGDKPIWHITKPHNWLLYLVRKLRYDVYLHRDTLRYFISEHIASLGEILLRSRRG